MTDIPSYLGQLAPLQQHDFSEFGETETQVLSNVQSLTGKFLGRNWVTIPHVTHNDDIDITALEARRQDWNKANPDHKLTPLVPLMKAMVAALKAFPKFNASLSQDATTLILKKYFHLGIAIDTPSGLLVGVIRDVDQKDMSALAREVADLAEKARTKGLSYAEMSGSCITLSSLGHIGGTSFSPIINAPDIAILGVLRSRDVPIRGENDEIVWRTHLPLSLSYDHRVINGVDAARFVKFLGDTALEAVQFN